MKGENEMNRCIESIMDTLSNEIISILIRQKSIPYDEAKEQFTTSITYQLLLDESSQFFEKSALELLELWYQEQIMDQYLSHMIQNTNHPLQDLVNQKIMESLKKKAFLMELPIEIVYCDFIFAKEGSSFSSKKKKYKK